MKQGRNDIETNAKPDIIEEIRGKYFKDKYGTNGWKITLKLELDQELKI